MPDDTGTEKTCSDAPSADESLFGDAVDDTPAAVADEQDSADETEQYQESPEDAGEGTDSEGEKEQGQQDVTEAGEPDADGETEQGQDDPGPVKEQADAGKDAPANELKVVVSIKEGRATIGVQRPSSDPHIESFDDLDESGLTQEVAEVIERARARWEESPKHPAYERPAPPARRRNRRQQGANADGETEAETQQQTLRLF